MLLSIAGCCAGVLADAIAPWLLLVPSASLFVGFLLTLPLRIESQ